jgi:putative tryptophan/tyrosine transport system substrate-binding protein
MKQFSILDPSALLRTGFGFWIRRSQTKKAFCLVLGAMLLAICLPADAQQQAKVPRIGYLRQGSPTSAKFEDDAFRQGLREFGYIEGKNILIEYRYAEGKVDRVPDLATELVRLKPDAIVVGGDRATRAAKEATSAIPIVVGSAGDLVGAGLVASLAKPGGNITGSTGIAADLSGKRLELLKEAIPKASRVAVLWYPSTGVTDEHEVQETETVARHLSVKVQPVRVRDPLEFQNAYAEMIKQHANAVIIIQGAFTLTHRTQLVELAAKHRLPSMCEQSTWTDDGCLMSYGRDQLSKWRRAAYFVDRILKGTKPADLPVEQPMKFEFVINLKTAKQIGLTIPPNVLARADRVIR